MVDGVITIHEDLISEILLRLPPISILRFKLVSKQWYSLLSNPNFLISHSIHHCRRLPSPTILIPKHCVTRVEDFNFFLLPHDDGEQVHLQSSSSSITSHSNFLDHVYSVLNSRSHRNNPYLFLYGSCNGLLLYTYVNLTCSYKQNYYVCNPVTNHLVQLPDIEKQFQVEKLPENCIPFSFNYSFIAFDPSISLTYKVFLLISSIDKYSKLYVYSSETRSWKHLSSTLLSSSLNVVLLNGVAYWGYSSTIWDALLCIDVEKESFWFLPLPPKLIGSFRRDCLYFGECGGRVRLIEKYIFPGRTENVGAYLDFPCSFDIMELDHQQQQEEDGRRNCTWSVKYRVNINTLPTGYDHLIRKKHFSVPLVDLYKTKNKGETEEEEEEVLLLNIDGTMVIPFNLDCKTFGKEIMVPNSRHCSFTDVMSYTMTLFPLL